MRIVGDGFARSWAQGLEARSALRWPRIESALASSGHCGNICIGASISDSRTLFCIMRHLHHTNLTHFLSSPLIIPRYPPISPFLQRWTPLPPLTTGATCHRFRFAPPRSPARLDVLQSISFFATERFALARDAADGIQPRHGHGRRSP